jgi:hypothetical protein
MSLPALAVPVVFGVVTAALTHPWLVIEKQLTASVSTRAAVPALLPCLASRSRISPTAAVATAAVAAAAAAIPLWAAGGPTVAPLAVTPSALPSGRVRCRIRGCWCLFQGRCNLL